MTHLDISSNELTDISIVEKIPSLTHLTANWNAFIHNWEWFAIVALPALTVINGRVLRDGEVAIDRDLVGRFVRSTRTPHPHRAISQIVLDFRALRDVEPEQMSPCEEIESIWMGRSRAAHPRAGAGL
jgi:hypothetical protein